MRKIRLFSLVMIVGIWVMSCSVPVGNINKEDKEDKVTATPIPSNTKQSTEEPAEKEDVTVEPTKTPELENNDKDESLKGTVGEQNALDKATTYLDIMAFSYNGLIKQLEFEGFTNKEAVYGADHSNADWNEQAVSKAKSYMDISSFSRKGLIEQLEFDGFTHEQAVHGVEANGY